MSFHRRFKAARRRVGGWCLRTFGPSVVTRLARTWKTEVLGYENVERALDDGGFIVSMWHGRMIVAVEYFRDRAWHVLVSPSDDGDLSENMLDALGYRVIRGSSSRGGSRALRALLEVLDARGVTIITPDGPRGPMHSMNPGVAWMAKATGRPIVPLGHAVDRAWHLPSWDRFTIPKPGARVVVNYGEPIHVPRKADVAELARVSEQLRERMLALEREGFERLGAKLDW